MHNVAQMHIVFGVCMYLLIMPENSLFNSQFIYLPSIFSLQHVLVQCCLTVVIYWMLMHGYLPESAMDTVTIPILKYKKGLLSDTSN